MTIRVSDGGRRLLPSPLAVTSEGLVWMYSWDESYKLAELRTVWEIKWRIRA